jgi:hypothetical protein
MVRLIILAGLIVLQTMRPVAAEEQRVGGATIRPLECQAIELPDQKMTICTEPKRGFRAAACSIVVAGLCWSNGVSAPLMGIALPIVKAAKDRGAFRDQGECEEIARDAGRLGGLLGTEGSIAGTLAGICGECVCRAVY